MKAPVRLLAQTLLARRETLATAESCTGGLLGGALTSLPGSSAWYLGGYVAYANHLKEELLGVPSGLLSRYGAVSAQTAEHMAARTLRQTQADWAVSITGIAGPGGGTPQKPVGLVYTGIAGPGGARTFRHDFHGSRKHIREQAVAAAIRRLLDELAAAGKQERGTDANA
ncbi:MAG: CinA family protein [Verrucomicrobiota bacterium]|nr:CinA family protein [Verrucomicrobiota bacterium]